MRYLTQGSQSQERFDLLLSLTSISSDQVIIALHYFLVRGFSESSAATLNEIPKSNFNRALKKLEQVASVVERLKERDLSISSVKR